MAGGEPNRADVAEGLLCKICKDVVIEAWTTVDCLHTFCFKCIEQHVEDQLREKKSVKCPACPEPLARNPFEATEGKGVRYDYAKDAIARAIFPRPEIDKRVEREREEREARRREERRLAGGNDPKISEEEYYRRKVPQKKGDRPKIKPGQIKSKTGGIVTQRALFIYLATDNGYLQEDGTPTLPNLDKPYLKVPAQMPVNCIRKFLQMALPDLKLKAEKIEILCMGQLVDPDWTCSFVYETMWEPFHIEGSKLTLFYRDPSRSAKHQ